MTVKTTAYWFDAEGNRVEDPADAVTGEIVDRDEDEGFEQRTYFDRSGEGDRPIDEVFSFDLDMTSQDGPKKTWDIRHPGTQELVSDLATLRLALGAGLPQAEWRSKLANMLQLPVWDSAPDELKREAYAWLVETRPVV